MKSKNTLRKCLPLLGCVLLIGALVCLIVTVIENGDITVNTADAVDFLEGVIPGRVPGVKEERSNNEMPSVMYEGQNYSAILSLERLSVTLPVRSTWDRNAVNKAPSRFTGSIYDGSLVVGGVDAEGQFDFIPEVDIGDVVTVTDMKGYVFTYTVSTVKHAKNAKSKTLIDEKYDLTLFAKCKKTGDWLLVRCNMN